MREQEWEANRVWNMMILVAVAARARRFQWAVEVCIACGLQ